MSQGPLWTPSEEQAESSLLNAFRNTVNQKWAAQAKDYFELHQWSIDHREEFWIAVWDFCGVIGERGKTVVREIEKMPGAQWFPDARLNFAENLLRKRDDSDALVFWGEDRARRRMSYAQLYRDVAQMAAAFQNIGLAPGDVVAAWMPNVPET